MWIFSQEGIARRRTGRTPHKQARGLTQRLRKKAIYGWKLIKHSPVRQVRCTIKTSVNKNTVVREATSTRPLIRIIDKDGIRAIAKDFHHNGFFFRNIFGRFLVWREVRAYRKLSGLKGVPRLLEVIEGPAIVLELVAGMPMKEAAKQKKLSPVFFDALKDMVDSIHEKGIVHCDLKNAGNIFVGSDGGPVILDWASSISEKEFGFFPLKIIYNRFLLDDYRAIIKHRLHFLPASVSMEERVRYNHRSLTEKTIRAIRDRLRIWLQKII